MFSRPSSFSHRLEGSSPELMRMGIRSGPCMKGGDGETSYAMNSSFQARAVKCLWPVVEEAIIKLVQKTNDKKLMIADLGCGTGPNTLSLVANIADTIEQACQRFGRPFLELQFFLNDLPENDFNSIFSLLQSNNAERNTNSSLYFIAAVAGSFYQRLFPERSINFFHSSFSLHWLSQDPLKSGQKDGLLINKGKIYISKDSPSFVKDAYSRQFKEDFSNFLKLRSVEMSIGSRMVLTLVGRWGHQDSCDEISSYDFDLLSTALMDMVQEGHVPEERVDSFNLPFYAPCPDEVADAIINEGSFSWDCLQAYYAATDPVEEENSSNLAKGIQALLEPQLESHFGSDIIGGLFTKFEKLLDETTAGNLPKTTFLIVSLVRSIPREFP